MALLVTIGQWPTVCARNAQKQGADRREETTRQMISGQRPDT
jgi:hypothetical protein